MVRADHLPRDGWQNAWTERTPPFPELDLVVNLGRYPLKTGTTKDTSTTERPRPELHTALTPRNRVPCRKELRGLTSDIAHPFINRLIRVGIARLDTLFNRVFWPKVDVRHLFRRDHVPHRMVSVPTGDAP